jgi:hypothetical protein
MDGATMIDLCRVASGMAGAVLNAFGACPAPSHKYR